MANFRTAEENFFNLLPHNYTDSVLQEQQESQEEDLKMRFQFFSFSVGNEGKRYLSELGINLAPYSTRSHPHPISKTIENWIIYRVVPGMVEQGKPFILLSSKGEKAKYIFKWANKRANSVSLINRVFEVKDVSRYEGQSVLQVGSCNFPVFSKRLGMRLSGTKNEHNIFIHDEVHHWTLDNFSLFLHDVEPRNLIFTCIYPPELLDGHSSSLNTLAYHFSIKGEKFFFFPDGKKGEPYEQERKNNWFMSLGKLRISSGGKGGIPESHTTYSISKVCSYGAHHVFSCVAGDVRVESTRFWNDFDCTNPSIFSGSFTSVGNANAFRTPVMRHWVMEKVLSYISCLKKPDVESALAKLRQLSEFNVRLEEMAIIDFVSGALINFGDTKDFITLRDYFMSPLSSICLNALSSRALSLVPFLNRSLMHKVMLSGFLSGDAVYSTSVEVVSLNWSKPKTNLLDTWNGEDYKNMNNFNDQVEVGAVERIPMPELECKLRLKKSLLDICNSHSKGFSNFQIPEGHGEPNNGEGGVGITDAATRNEGLSTLIDVNKGKAVSESEGKQHEGSLPENGIASERQADSPSTSTSQGTQRKNGCFFEALAGEVGTPTEELISKVFGLCGSGQDLIKRKIIEDLPLTEGDIREVSQLLGMRISIHMGSERIDISNDPNLRRIHLGGRPGHIFRLTQRRDVEAAQVFEDISKVFIKTFGVERPKQSERFINTGRATSLLRAFRSMNLGALIDRQKVMNGSVLSKGLIRYLFDHNNDPECLNKAVKVETIPFVGFAGSGKSHGMLERLIDGQEIGNFLFVAPRKSIIDQVVGRITCDSADERVARASSFKTYEVALLAKGKNSVVCLDEISQLPPGYTDLLGLKLLDEELSSRGATMNEASSINGIVDSIIKEGGLKLMVPMTGDVVQPNAFFENCPGLNGMVPELVYALSFYNKAEIPYLYGTRRFGKPNVDFLDLPFYGNSTSNICFLNSVGQLNLDAHKDRLDRGEIVCLVASHSDKASVNDLGMQTYTFGESQGSSFLNVVVYVTLDFFKVSLDMLLVGLTRHKYGLYIVVDQSVSGEIQRPDIQRKPSIGVISGDFSFLRRFVEEKIERYLVITKIPFGNDFELKTEGDPFLKSMLFMLRSSLPNEPEPDTTAEPNEPKLKTHIPIQSINPLDILMSSNMKPKEVREFVDWKTGPSNQFNDLDRKMVNCPRGAFPFNPEAIFPRHRNEDQTTFWMAVKKRLRFAEPRENIRKYREARPIGRMMLKELLKRVPIDPTFVSSMMDLSREEFEQKKVSKSASLIKNHHVRSLADWDKHEIFIFIKTQLCTKIDKMFTDAKAGQTLACFSHKSLVYFAPYARYIEKKLTEALPHNLYIHQKKNFDDLNSWVKANDFSGVCTESDYEAFDASQTAFSLAFEVELFKHLQLDEDFIDAYIGLKTHLSSKMGNLSIMRFTGEFSTFLFNTLINMVFTFMRYDIKEGTSICFAGDDMCANRRLGEKGEFDGAFFKKIDLKAKVGITSRPAFCGWHLSEHGLIKEPKLVEARLQVAVLKGNLKEVIDSYFLDYKYAFEMGDKLMEVLDDEQLGYHYSLTRFFVKHSHLMNGESVKILKSQEKEGGLLFGECLFGCKDMLVPKLGKGVLIPENIYTWQSSQSKDFLTQSPVSKMKFSLMHSGVHTYTTMLESFQGRGMMKSENFSYQSRLRALGSQGWLAQISTASIRPRLITYGLAVTSTALSISGQFFSLLLAFLRQGGGLMGSSYTLMGDLAMRSRHASQVLSSLCAAAMPYLHTSLITRSQHLSLTLGRQVKYYSSIVAYQCLRVHMPSISTLVTYTGSRIKVIFEASLMLLEKLSFKSYWEYTGSGRSVMSRQDYCLSIVMNKLRALAAPLLLKGIEYLRRTSACAFENMKLRLGQGLIESKRMMKSMMLQGCLLLCRGVSLCVESCAISCFLGLQAQFLIIKYLESISRRIQNEKEKMSIVHQIRESIRAGIEAQVWNMIDPGNLLHLVPPEDGPPLTQEQGTTKKAVLGYYLDFLVGNVAILGASKETQYPNVNLEIRPPAFQGFQWPENLRPNFNLADFVRVVEAWAANQPAEHIKNCTRRQLFEPFAVHAMHFLQADPRTRITNIAMKRSYQCRSAPEVAFDFASGLPPHVLNDARAKVISALTANLFHTEGQKGVFEAKGFVQMNFDG